MQGGRFGTAGSVRGGDDPSHQGKRDHRTTAELNQHASSAVRVMKLLIFCENGAFEISVGSKSQVVAVRFVESWRYVLHWWTGRAQILYTCSFCLFGGCASNTQLFKRPFYFYNKTGETYSLKTIKPQTREAMSLSQDSEYEKINSFFCYVMKFLHDDFARKLTMRILQDKEEMMKKFNKVYFLLAIEIVFLIYF